MLRGMPELCPARHPTTGAQCVSNVHDGRVHSWGPSHRIYFERLGTEMSIRLHLASRHALANAFDPQLTMADMRGIHDHEHDGPGTIRNHDRRDERFDLSEVVLAISESLDAVFERRTRADET